MSAEQTAKPAVWRRFLFFLRILEIRLRFVAILVVTALVVGYWDTIENYYERWQRHRHAESPLVGEAAGRATVGDIEYFCGMHPFVVRDAPGKCPICGMDLVPRKKGAAAPLPPGVLARVQSSPDRVLQAGVQVEPVAYRLLSREVRSYGTIEPDETRMARIIGRFPGRVEELMVNTTGVTVKKDEPLARIYSAKFLAAAEEYIQALAGRRQAETSSQASENEKRRAVLLAQYARQRLALAGFTDEQLNKLAESGQASEYVTLHSPLTGTVLEKNVLLGQMVDEGSTLYTIADLSTLWIQAQILESDLGAVRVGMPVEVTTVSYPGSIFYGSVDFISPTVNRESRSVKARIIVGNREGRLKPGMYVTAVLRTPVGRWGQIGTPEEPAKEESATGAMTRPAAKPASAATSETVRLPTTALEEAKAYLATLPPAATYYVCPMHPQVVSDHPGNCPECGMKLIQASITGARVIEPPPAPPAPVAPADASAPAGAPPRLPTQTLEQARAFEASLSSGSEYYTCPMHADVVSDKPGECPLCGMYLKRRTWTPPPLESPTATVSAIERWAEGFTCAMHLDHLESRGGTCTVCGCGMTLQPYRVERVLAIPESAVVDTGERKIVYAEFAPGVFDAHQVTLGSRAGSYYPVLDGLNAGDRIATRGSFLLDAEARLNPSTSYGGAGATAGMPGMPGMKAMPGMPGS